MPPRRVVPGLQRVMRQATTRPLPIPPRAMYASCITCHGRLGRNREIAVFPVGERIAFDAARGRLWVVCPHCARWNLSPLEERWEAIEECERRFRGAHLRVSTGEVGLARLESGTELVRIGRALRSEVAAWRYGDRLLPRGRRGVGWLGAGVRGIPGLRPGLDAATWLRLRWQPGRAVAVAPAASGERVVLRVRHLAGAELVRPDRLEPWRLVVAHETGPLELTSDAGLHTAGKLLAALNGAAAPAERVRAALRRLDDAGNPDSYFARVAALALRTSWGRLPDAPRDIPVAGGGTSAMEQLALRLASRSFWAHGGTSSAPRIPLLRLSPEDRLALEMAAHEDDERRALAGELSALEAAWRDAEEVAAIADGLFARRAAPAESDAPWWRPVLRLPRAIPGLG